MFFYREAPPSDPWASATVFRDDFTSGFDTTNIWQIFDSANNVSVIDHTSLSNPLNGSTKALQIFTNGYYAYGGGIRINPTFQSGIWQLNNDTKSFSIRGMIRYGTTPDVGRCGLSLKVGNGYVYGYVTAIGNSDPAGWTSLPGTTDTILSTAFSYGNNTLVQNSFLPTIAPNIWKGFRMDLQKVAGYDEISIYTRDNLNESWTYCGKYSSGNQAWSSDRTLGFISVGAGPYSGANSFKAYLSNFEIYVKDGPI